MTPVLITTTVGTGDDAQKIADILVERKIAACVNIIGPVQSVYTWNGKIEKENEYKLFIKSFHEKWQEVRSTIQANHPYSVPEISLIVIQDMHNDYLKWMLEVIE